MTEIRFYHLTRSSLEQTLPVLLERTLSKGWKAVVKASSVERVESLNQHLWTYNDRAFLPHGSAKDGDGPLQPVWLTEGDDVPNGASVLFLVDGAETASPQNFELVCLVFDGDDPDLLGKARQAWKIFKDGNQHQLTYWQQSDQGGWEQKASHDPSS